jgi:hypothetical protein
VADPALVRRLDVGQAAYIYRGGVTFVQVKRLLAAPAALATPAGPDRAPGTAAAAGATAPAARTAWPAGAPAAPHLPGVAAQPGRPATAEPAAAEVTALLDEAFGAEPG